ncbi:MAG TPA: hypothetical protein VN944_07060, partial [Nitrospiria bacterium]|nr:hypothetical protein [Nitrospiria bacterium]
PPPVPLVQAAPPPQPEMQILRNSDTAAGGSAQPSDAGTSVLGTEDFSMQGASLLDALAKEESPNIPAATSQPGFTEGSDDLTELQVKEKLAEGEFYSQQGLLGEARIIYETVLKFNPEHPLAKAKLQRILSEMGESVEAIAPSGNMDFGLANEILADESLSSSDLGFPDELASSPSAVEPGKVRLKTTILDKTEGTDFVNLAGELEDQFKEDAAVASEGDVQEEDFGRIIKEFQKGIQNSISEKDYETHFDLGIAYKEMGLRNEAIGEFQFSVKGGGRVVDSAIMLSQCYLEAGLSKIAIEQLQKIVQSPQLTKDQTHSLKYEMGCLFEKEGRNDEATEIFGDILKENVSYRDVSKKIAKLRDVPARKS